MDGSMVVLGVVVEVLVIVFIKDSRRPRLRNPSVIYGIYGGPRGGFQLTKGRREISKRVSRRPRLRTPSEIYGGPRGGFQLPKGKAFTSW